MKVFNKLLMFTLILSVFAGCKKDDEKVENLPIADVVGTYKGTITIPNVDTVNDVSITITTLSSASDSVSLVIPQGSIPVFPLPINASCQVTSDTAKYSLSGTATVILPDGNIPIPVEVKNNSHITKTGTAAFNIDVKLPQIVPPGITLPVTFEGEKQ
jgi:hypothetical protein